MPTTESTVGKPVSVLVGADDDGRRFLNGTFDEFTQAPPPHTDTRPAFVSTREHRRFVEFADTVRSHRYIGPKGWPAPSRPRGRPAESNGVLHPHRRRHHQADRPGPAPRVPTSLVGH